MNSLTKRLRSAAITVVALCGFASFNIASAAAAPAAAASETGLAAVYTTRLAGHKTASGKVYNPSRMTMAHKTLPFGTKVKVTNKKNGRSVVLTVTDRGPTQAGRVADISSAAAKRLGIRPHAMAEVELTPQ